MRRFLTGAFVVIAAVASAGAAHAIAPNLPPGWSHAEINVIVKRVPHTLIYDRGRVQAVTPSSLTVREGDGSSVTIEISPSSRIRIAGRPASLAQVRRREIATILRIDGGAAVKVTVRVPPALAALRPAKQARRKRGG